jgi:crossover junction endodeoxyribonuclease RuvC
VRILGIDPGTATTGWAIVEQTKSELFIAGFDVITTSKDFPLADRLLVIYEELNDIIKNFKPDYAAVEELFFAKNVKTAISVSHARGVILLALKANNIPFAEFAPNQVKIALTGYGKANKSQMQNAVKIVTGLSFIPKPDDAADAIAIAICGILTSRNIT